MSRPHQVLVIYKSGAQIRISCEDFVVRKSPLGHITSVTWSNPSPEPLHLGVDEVAAVFKIR